MASNYPITWAASDAYPTVRLFTIKSGVTFSAYDLVFWNTTGVDLCGADPANILGIALTGTADAALTTPGRVPVAIIDPRVVFMMSSATTPADDTNLTAYGIVRTSAGRWRVDTSDTSNTRLTTIGFTPQRATASGTASTFGFEGYYVRFLAANLQGDGIAS